MQKAKRLIAVLLAMLMIMTTFSASTIAFAEEVSAKDEFAGYLPENFDKKAAESKFDNFVNRLSKGAKALLTEVDEELVQDEVTPTENAQKFMKVMDGVSKPYTDAMFGKAFNSYYRDVANFEDLKTVPTEYIEKYSDIFNWFVDAHMNKTPYDLKGYKQESTSYPKGADYTRVTEFLENMNPVISQTLADMLVPGTTTLQAALEKGVYTNYTVTMVDATIYKMLAGIDLSGLGGMAGAMLGALKKILITYPNQVGVSFDEDSEAYDTLVNKIGGNAQSDATKPFVPTNPDCEAQKRYEEAHELWEAILNNPEPEPKPADFYWDYAVEIGIDYGFEDGDREGFIKALSTSLNRIGDIINIVVTLSEKDNRMSGAEKIGQLQYGLYDDIAMLLEILGAEDFMTHAEYQEFVRTNQTVQTKDETTARQFEALLTAVFNFVEQIAEAPATQLMTVLPKVAYLINSGDLSTYLNNAIERNKTPIWNFAIDAILPGMYPFDLSLAFERNEDGTYKEIPVKDANGNYVYDESGKQKTEKVVTGGLFALLEGFIDPEVVNGAARDGAFVLDLDLGGTAVKVNITDKAVTELIENLAHRNKVWANKSKTSRMQLYIPIIQANSSDAFVELFNWVYKFLGADVLAYTVANVEADPATQLALQAAARVMATLPAGSALVVLINALEAEPPTLPDLPNIPEGPDAPEEPDDGEIFPSLPPFLDSIVDTILGFLGLGGNDSNDGANDNNNNDDNDGFFGDDDDDADLVGDPDIPHTAGTVAGGAAAIAVLAAVSATGIAFVVKKKHEDE